MGRGLERNHERAILVRFHLAERVHRLAAARSAGRALPFDGEALLRQAESGEVKQRLRRATESAVAAGVFGVPTMTVAGELFWGYDDFHWLERLLAGADRLDTDKRRLWSDLRPSAVRPGSRRGRSRAGEQDSS